MNQDNEDPRCQQCRQAKIQQCLPGSKKPAGNPAAPGSSNNRNTWRRKMRDATKAKWQAQNERSQAENANAALNRQIAELQRQSQQQSNLLKAQHRQELDELQMTIQQRINDKRRLETPIQTLGDHAESNSESNAELRRRLASTMQSLHVTQQDLSRRQNEQIEQQQAIDDARDRGIAELQRSLLKPLAAGEQNPFQFPNSQALLNPAAAGQQNPPQFSGPNQQGSMGMPMMGQMPDFYNSPMGQPNASYGQGSMGMPMMGQTPYSYNSQMGQPDAYGQGTQYGQSTMPHPQFQPWQGGAGYPGNYGYPANYGNPGNHGNQSNDGGQSSEGGA
ncbi:hypothetical protein KC354_g1519 [Hortaea werneckii]|nr:hypothetical protein KC354_g1519 [Hortaea werneckii]